MVFSAGCSQGLPAQKLGKLSEIYTKFYTVESTTGNTTIEKWIMNCESLNKPRLHKARATQMGETTRRAPAQAVILPRPRVQYESERHEFCL